MDDERVYLARIFKIDSVEKNGNSSYTVLNKDFDEHRVVYQEDEHNYKDLKSGKLCRRLIDGPHKSGDLVIVNLRRASEFVVAPRLLSEKHLVKTLEPYAHCYTVLTKNKR